MTLLANLLLLAACSEADTRCGKGTHLEGDTCVADEPGDTGSGEDSGTDSDTGTDSGTDSGTDTDTGADSDTATDTDTDTGSPPERRVVGYFVEWGVYDRDYRVADIPVDALTHVNYAFIDVTAEGECQVYDSWAALELDGGNYAQLVDLHTTHPDLRVLMSLGGWTLSSHFSDAALTESSREALVSSCVDFMQTYGFDGIDVDWEYPVEGGLTSGRPEDTENFTLLLAEFRKQIDALGGDHLLTIAAPGGDDKIANIQALEVAAQVDWLNVMAYDFYGAWDTKTGFNAPLVAPSDSPHANGATYNVDAAVRAYLDAGVPADKIVVGMPLYGRGWGGVGATDDGLYQPASGASSLGTWEAGVFDYADLAENYVGADDWIRGWHDEASVPWLYSPSQQVFISYDDEESFDHKLDYIDAEGLGGAMLWELDADTVGHDLVWQVSDRLK